MHLIENTSGRGPAAIVPPEIDRWNWGAFFLHWIWGIGNSTWLALLMFVPCVGLVMPFVLGARGSAWAWRNRRWESVEAFKATQRTWAIWGAVVWATLIALFGAMFVAIMVMMKNSEPYQMAVAAVHADPQAPALLGEPISTGYPSGELREVSLGGYAQMQIPIKGPKGRGTVYMQATRKLGRWTLDEAYLQMRGQDQRVDLTD
jgi:hypothetical protein